LSALGASSRAVDGFTIERADRTAPCLSCVCTRHEPCIIRYGGSVPIPGPDPFARLGHWVGWPSSSHGPASIDPSPAHPIAVSLSHRPRSPRHQHFGGPAPRGASCDGPPAPHRLEQPSPSTSPISDVPMSSRGHRLAGSRTCGKLARRTPRDARFALTLGT